MNKQKAISSLQSRIAKRKNELGRWWKVCGRFGIFTKTPVVEETIRVAIMIGNEQKFDKALLKLLYADAMKQQYYADVVYDLQRQITNYRRQLASYKLTGQPYEGD